MRVILLSIDEHRFQRAVVIKAARPDKPTVIGTDSDFVIVSSGCNPVVIYCWVNILSLPSRSTKASIPFIEPTSFSQATYATASRPISSTPSIIETFTI